MGSVERILHVADKVIKTRQAGNDVIVCVSAMSGQTNNLVALAQQMQAIPDAREYDALVSTGEQVSIALLVMALKSKGQDAQSFCGWQVPIVTDDAHSKARIHHIPSDNLNAVLAAGKVAVVAGFQGVSPEGAITTLGRGGSDTTAVAIAAAMQADECQIYTDVDGVYTTDPRVEPNARRLDKITFEEMLEMASLGSKILQIRSVEFAGKYKVPLRVMSTFEEGEGTLISLDEEQAMEQAVISGIAFNRDEARLTVAGVPDHPGIAAAILGPISAANIEVDMIVQNIGGAGLTDFTFTVNCTDFAKATQILNQVKDEIKAREVITDEDIVKVSIVGVGMRSHAGIASTVFQILAQENINIMMISTSEIKISVVINKKYLELAVRSLHLGLGLSEE